MVWLDCITSTTTSGPIFIVCTFADHPLAQDQTSLQRLSSTLDEKLATHPAKDRVIRNTSLTTPDGSSFSFFPIDNTQQQNGSGLQHFMSTLLDTSEHSKCAQKHVPTWVAYLQDTLVHLTNPSTSDFVIIPQVADEIAKIRHELYQSGSIVDESETTPLPYITLDQFHRLCKSIHPDGTTEQFESCLTSLHNENMVSHFNTPELRHMVILDTMWLIDAFTTIIRDPSLHPCKCDAGIKIFREPMKWFSSLYSHGELNGQLIPMLLNNHNEVEQKYIINTMIQVSVLMSSSLNFTHIHSCVD